MFNKLREKTGKQFVKKYQYPFGPLELEQNYIGSGYYRSAVTGQIMNINTPIQQMSPDEEVEAVLSGGATRPSATLAAATGDTTDLKALAGGFVKSATGQDTSDLTGDAARGANMATNMETNAKAHTKNVEKAQASAKFKEGFGGEADGTMGSAINNFASGNWKTGLVDTAVAGMKTIDDLAMGDKNFGAQSQAIDDAIHGVSGALMKSGNPYCLIAGAALESANFLTKAGGQTVQGFDVDINSSGYGDIGHMESSSSRDFGALIGLGGIFNKGKMQAKLAKRNQQAMMAMNAANIANEQSFEQEARANSIQNTIMNNQIALSGGLETSLLGG